jgi:hypothetical protein
VPKAKRYDFTNIGGGQYSGLPAHRLADNQFEELTNFYSFGTKIIRRGGIHRLTDDPYDEQITSVFSYKNLDTDEYILFVGGLTGIGKKDGSGYFDLPYSLGGTLSTEFFPWAFAQYKNIAYAVRRNTGRMKRVASDFFTDAGIDPPDTAPTLADSGVAGNPSAANYYGVVTFYNNETGAESDPSDPSALVTTGGARQIDWSSIPTAVPQGQVTSRRLWRTLPNQTGVYYLVAELGDNITTTYRDNVSTAGLGAAASYKNGLPPTNQKYMAMWKERCWLSNGVDVWYSEIGLPESFGPSSLIQIEPDDGGEIRVLFGWQDRLVIGKTNGLYYLVGTDESDFALNTLSKKHGCWAPFSMKEIEGNLIWYAGDNFYRSGGENPQAISNYQVREELDEIAEDEREQVFAAVLPEKNWYLALLPTGKILCYNYKTNAWAVWTTTYDYGFITDGYDDELVPKVYGCHGSWYGDSPPALGAGRFPPNHAWEFDYGLQDDLDSRGPYAIDASFLTKAHAFEGEGMGKAVRGAGLLMPTYSAEATLGTVLDTSGSVTKSRTVSLNVPRFWKRYSLSDINNLGRHVQLKLTYSGTPQIEIEGYALEVIERERLGRRY